MEEHNFEVKPKPRLSESNVKKLVEGLYGLRVQRIKELDGYDDANYWIQVENSEGDHAAQIWPHGYVLKIMNEFDSKNELLVEAQNKLMLFLGNHKLSVPQPVMNLRGSDYTTEIIEYDYGRPPSKNIVRLLTFQPGMLLKDAHQSAQLYFNVGKYLGDVIIAMKDFSHPSMVERSSLWALQNCLMIRNLIYVIEDPEKKSLVLHVLNQFDQLVLPKIDCLEKGIIHGDFNEHNIIVEDDKVISLIDFGDSQYAPVLFEIAICLCYIILQGQHFEMCKHVLEGLKTRRILTSLEITLLKISICARLCQSLVLGLYTYSKDPNNKYVLSSQINGWKQLQMLVPMEQAVLENSWNLEGHNENQ